MASWQNPNKVWYERQKNIINEMMNPKQFMNWNSQEERDMMTDPTKVSYRIFVGGLPTDDMTRDDLIKLLEPFGPVAGVVLNKGFGFAQFEDEASARAAINDGGITCNIKGRFVQIKPARPMYKQQMQMEAIRDRSPLGIKDIKDRGRDASRFPTDRRMPPHFMNKGPNFMSSAGNSRAANDIEIIVVNKNQTEYAEYIEGKLRRMGLAVDLLFPNGDVPVTRVISNIANTGCLFAIVIMPQNEEHRSVTLNILHGAPQEHRNMPLEDAFDLVSRSYEEYKLNGILRPSEVPVVPAAPLGGATLADRHPESIQILLNLLAENRMLTVIQYDKIIAYLQSRKEMQLKVELGDAAPPSALSAPPMGIEKQTELQSRILSILNNKTSVGAASTAISSAAAAPATASSTSSAPKLLSDPSVQRALSSIMDPAMLRKLTDSRPNL